MTEELKLDLMKKFKELNVAEYTAKYGDYYGLMFAGAEIATKELKETYKKQRNKRIDELQKKNHDLEAQIEKMKCCFNCSRFDTCSLHRPCRNYNEWQLRR